MDLEIGMDINVFVIKGIILFKENAQSAQVVLILTDKHVFVMEGHLILMEFVWLVQPTHTSMA